jgi:hypothetical protein
VEQITISFSGTGCSDLNPIVYDFDLENTYQPPSPVKPANPMRVNLLKGPKSHSSVVAAWKSFPSEVSHKKMRLCFDKPVALQINSRKKTAEKPVHEFRLFVTTDGVLCHTNTRRTGFPFDADDLCHLLSMEPVPDADMVEKVRSLANRIYPGVWEDLKTKLLANPEEYFQNYGYTVTSISGKFPDYVLADIKTAFEVKSNYTHDTGGRWGKAKNSGRDLRIECKLGDDGIYRAWFSSEFPGCANGDYWLLINPTTAIFKERD